RLHADGDLERRGCGSSASARDRRDRRADHGDAAHAARAAAALSALRATADSPGDLMAHSHAPGGHDHGTRRAANRKRLALTLALVVLYMGAEVVGGLLTNSLALLADAGHMF